jgi:hypothetical protein
MNMLHFENLFFKNHWANLNQTGVLESERNTSVFKESTTPSSFGCHILKMFSKTVEPILNQN